MSRYALAELILRNDAALLIAKTTIVLAFAAGAAVAARRASAARRHMIWLAALSSCVWLAVSSPIVPSIVIHSPFLASHTVPTTITASVEKRMIGGSTTIANAPQTPERLQGRVADPLASVASPPWRGTPVVAVWIVGCFALLVRYAVAYVGAIRLARRATIASDPALRRELAHAARAAGVRRRIALGYSARLASPVTFGFVKPLVLLPVDAGSWSSERRQAVLVHEAAHVARGDWVSQSIGRLACALLWFHPLVWLAFARLRDEAERAADDCVLSSGISALDYAAHLLALARRTSAALPNVVAVGIVTSTHLERRFLAMLDNTRSRATVTSRARRIGTSVAVAVICPLASLRFAAPTLSDHSPVAHRATVVASVAAIVPHAPSARAPIVPPSSPAISTPPRVSVAPDSAAPQPSIEHPDLSGRWTDDSTAAAAAQRDGISTDTVIITQTPQSISFERFGSARGRPTHFLLRNLPFDGSPVTGAVTTGDVTVLGTASAVWEESTLVITSHVQANGKEIHAVERITLGADGKTQAAVTRNFIDGRDLWNGTRTFVLRRISP